MGSPTTLKFILLESPPVQVVWAGKQYRVQIEREPVSQELRLFAVDVQCQCYSAYLLMTSGKQADFDRRMFTDGVESESRPSVGLFRQLVADGKARAVTLVP